VNMPKKKYDFKMPIILGSGITVYVIQVSDAGNFTVKVDDGKTASKTLPYLDGSWSNITLCDIQSLPYEDHILTVVVQNWTDSKGIGETSSILFDFAAVNETVAVLSARSHTATGHIVGGIVGGLFVILVVIVALFRRDFVKKLFRRHSDSQSPENAPASSSGPSNPHQLGVSNVHTDSNFLTPVSQDMWAPSVQTLVIHS